MTKQMRIVLAMMLATAMVPALAQTDTTSTAAKKKHKPATKTTQESEELREIRAMREDLQKQINELKQQVADRDAKLASTDESAKAAAAAATVAATKADEAASSSLQNDGSVKDLQGQINTLQVSDAAAIKTVTESTKKLADSVESPTALHYKGITIAPLGFLAAEAVYRSRSINSDINTPFNSTPFMNADQAHTSELNGSGRQSRIGAVVTGTLPWAKLTGFYEADFLSAGVTSNNNQSNSYTLRQRQVWGQVAMTHGFTFTGGQMWSLVTETKKSTNNATENLPMTIDPQYHVGFSWARQYGLRFQQTIGTKTTIALGLEQAQTIFSAAGSVPTNFFYGSTGTGGGLYNAFNGTYTNNVAPDVIVKATFDPRYGHYEVGGIMRFFRDRYYPAITSSVGAVNDTAVGGGFIANARFPVTTRLDVGLHVLSGTGVGRYGTSGLSDVTVETSGTATNLITTFAPLKAHQGLLSLEVHPTKKLDVFGYAGAEYVQRTTFINPVTGLVEGYAPITVANGGCNTEPPTSVGGGTTPASAACGAVTRAVIEGTFGYLYRFYNGPKGKLQYSVAYSYLKRETWTGTGGSPNGTNNMVFTGFRYYMP